MRRSTLFLVLICNFLFFQLSHAQVRTTLQDSVDALMIHYKEINNNDLTLLDYVTVVAQEHVVIIEKRKYFEGIRIQKRIYPFNSDCHKYQFDKDRASQIMMNERLFHVQLDSLDTKEIAGQPCIAANYKSGKQSLKAYFNDMHGIKFSTTANYHGLALYYEKEMGSGISKYQADWIKQRKVHKSLVSWLDVNLKDSNNQTNPTSDIRQQFNVMPSGREHLKSYWKNKLSYINSNNEQVVPQNLYGSVVLGAFVKTIEKANQIILPRFKKIMQQFPNRKIKYIIIIEEDRKHLDPNIKIEFSSTIDFIPSGRKYLRNLGLHKSTEIIIADRRANIRYAFSEKTNTLENVVEALQTCLNTQYYHGYINPKKR